MILKKLRSCSVDGAFDNIIFKICKKTEIICMAIRV